MRFSSIELVCSPLGPPSRVVMSTLYRQESEVSSAVSSASFSTTPLCPHLVSAINAALRHPRENSETRPAAHGLVNAVNTALGNPRQIPDDFPTRPAGHGPNTRETSAADRATVTERWSSSERDLYGWGRRSHASQVQGGMSSLSGYRVMHHNSIPATTMTERDVHSGRGNASSYAPPQQHSSAAALSSLLNERPVGFMPYHLWEAYENFRLRLGRNPDVTRASSSGTDGYATWLMAHLANGRASPSQQRSGDDTSPPATSHGTETPSRIVSHSMNVIPDGEILSSTQQTSSSTHQRWNLDVPRLDRCVNPDSQSRSSSQPDYYCARPRGPGLSQREITSPPLSASVIASSSSSSSSSHATYTSSSGVRRVRTGFVNTSRHVSSGRTVSSSGEPSRRNTNPRYANSATTNHESATASVMEGQSQPRWRRNANPTAPSSSLEIMHEVLHAEWRALMRSVPNNNAQDAARATYARSHSFRPVTADLPTAFSDGQGATPRAPRNPGRGRWGVLRNPSSYSSYNGGEAGPRVSGRCFVTQVPDLGDTSDFDAVI
ncbi:hypothetical protein AXG93_1971s1030 [Marchantia polymorpha subsp. ruderalis]|uniref:Uncharacterized protein n=1 Tax=Marchantia polymorpha subsp. ruderalis TaxID=1480154 RepID=A0A176WIA7_MARPO|nr:hypothetical protein AXG93_1971s1030 [Marchantia polymorpha subsp. ruderalis]